MPFIPQSYKTYREPFFGGGALFFALQPKTARLTDRQMSLMETYRQVRDHPQAVINRLSKLENTEASFYATRSIVPNNPTDRAARMIYLCNLSFNGIHRVNKQGLFNVPYGYKTHLPVCDKLKLRKISALLQSAEVECEDFEPALNKAETGDLIYLDPPYTVSHGNNGFVKYNAKIFSWEDQERLAYTAEQLRLLGCFVIISNANHPSIRALYPNFDEHSIQRHSIMAASSAFRKPITESLFCGVGANAGKHF